MLYLKFFNNKIYIFFKKYIFNKINDQILKSRVSVLDRVVEDGQWVRKVAWSLVSKATFDGLVDGPAGSST
jgi:hypothetical protein